MPVYSGCYTPADWPSNLTLRRERLRSDLWTFAKLHGMPGDALRITTKIYLIIDRPQPVVFVLKARYDIVSDVVFEFF